MGLVDRAFLLSHSEFYQKNLELLISYLIMTDKYPFSLIFKTIDDLKVWFGKKKHLNRIMFTKLMILIKKLYDLQPPPPMLNYFQKNLRTF